MRKLLKHIHGYGLAALLAPLLILLETVFQLILPRLMREIIDVGIQHKAAPDRTVAGLLGFFGVRDLMAHDGFRYILSIGVLMLALALLSILVGVLSFRFSAKASQGLGYNLRRAMFEATQDFSFADIDRFSSASLITRLTNDVNNIQQTVNMGLRMLVRAPVMLVVALIICFGINARLTLILLLVVPVMALGVGLVMRAAHKLFETYQKKIDGLNASVQENLIGIRVVKAFVREGYERTKFARSNDALRDAGIKAVTTVVLMQPIMMLSFNVALVLVLYLGGRLVVGGTLLTGELYSFISYITNILMGVMMLAFTLLQLTRARASADRIHEVLEAVPDIRDREGAAAIELPEARGRVEFRNVSFKYVASGSGDDVLRGIDLTIEPGQFVAVVGGTGVGKSSLVNLIPRFYDVTGGQVLVDGLDVRDYPVHALRERIGMVLQKNVLFTGTVRENLLWGKPNATEEELVQAARDAQAYDFIMARPEGFDTALGQGGVNVSGGQKQRLCIARAMLRHPAILILDDSTSAVDSATEAAIRRSFAENLRGTTVIIIAQRVSSVRWADKIVVLEDDHIAGLGTHEELLQSCKVYQEIVNSQQEGVMGEP